MCTWVFVPLKGFIKKILLTKKKKGIEIELLHNFFFFKDSFNLQRPLFDNCSLSSDPKSHIQPQEISTVELTRTYTTITKSWVETRKCL